MPVATIVVRGMLGGRLMGKEKDPRQFEKGGEVREVQTRNISEEASEEDC